MIPSYWDITFVLTFLKKEAITIAKFIMMSHKKKSKEKKVHITDRGFPTHEKPSRVKKIKKKILIKLRTNQNPGTEFHDDCL